MLTVGMPVYFVYREWDNSLTLRGHSSIKGVVNELDEKYDHPTLYFEPFEPLPTDEWITGLTGESITGSSWRQGLYRHLSEEREAYLNSLVHRTEVRTPVVTAPVSDFEKITISLRRDIKEKIESIAFDEGREIDEIIREALAKFIRDRKH
jgi:hypothetical protein